MAILVDFQKVREDQLEVEYVFGAGRMDRQLVIRKESQEGTPRDGNKDKNYVKILWQIVGFYQNEARWPEKGSYAA